MTLAGGCANKNLVRLGGGSIRSLVVLAFMAMASYMTLKGLFAQWRATALDPVRIDLAERGWTDSSLATALAQADRHGAQGGAAGGGRPDRAGAAGLRLQGPALPLQHDAGGGRRRPGRRGRLRLVPDRPPRLRRESRHPGDRLLRHQQPHARIAELRRAAGVPAGTAVAVDRRFAARDLRHRQRAGRRRRARRRMRSRPAPSAGRASPRWPTCATSWPARC